MHGLTFCRMGTLAACVTLVGCSSLLPRSKTDVANFSSFEEARLAVESLQPGVSTLNTLAALGLNPQQHPNAVLLTHTDITRRFLPSNVLSREDLDPGVVRCIQARDGCTGVAFSAMHLEKQRIGNFWADFFNFSRTTHTSGWRFEAIVLLVGNQVAYRNWGGQPVVNEKAVENNPLGPFQDIGPATVTKR